VIKENPHSRKPRPSRCSLRAARGKVDALNDELFRNFKPFRDFIYRGAGREIVENSGNGHAGYRETPMRHSTVLVRLQRQGIVTNRASACLVLLSHLPTLLLNGHLEGELFRDLVRRPGGNFLNDLLEEAE